MNLPTTWSAFQGHGWKPRKTPMSAEIRKGRGIWAPWQVNSEYKKLRAVLIYCPGDEIRAIRRPNDVQHFERIDGPGIRKEYAGLTSAFRRLGVEVHLLPPSFESGEWPHKYNLMYVRDLFFNTTEGAVVSRMASVVRAGEEKHVAYAVSHLGLPIARTIGGKGIFEGADALWLGPSTVVCGIGQRTNADGFRQLREVLRSQGVDAIAVRIPNNVQHLLGMLQVVDSRLALLRTSLASRELERLLRRLHFSILRIPEHPEVTQKQGMNIVTVAPRVIVMPHDCPELKRLYAKAGLSIAAELKITELRHGAGGLACAVGILARDT